MRRRSTLLAVLASATLLAGACTAGGGNKKPSIVPTGGSHAPVTLTMWSGFTNPEFGYFNHTIKGFEKRYPWIHVNTVPGKQDTDVLNAIHDRAMPPTPLPPSRRRRGYN